MTADGRTIALDFSRRASLSAHPELMDEPCSFADLRACLHDIAQVNRLTFAYRPTLAWLEAIVRPLSARTEPLHIVDVGCGYGDLLRRIDRWAWRRSINVRLTGIDLNPYAVRAAKEVTRSGRITYLEGNAFTFEPPEGIDLVVSSLMTHHLEDDQVIEFLRWMERSARVGWFINDLHRQPMPYHLFKLLTRLTRWHRFVKHDGAVSILRSFQPADWTHLCASAGLAAGDCTLLPYRPARLCVARHQ